MDGFLYTYVLGVNELFVFPVSNESHGASMKCFKKEVELICVCG